MEFRTWLGSKDCDCLIGNARIKETTAMNAVHPRQLNSARFSFSKVESLRAATIAAGLNNAVAHRAAAFLCGPPSGIRGPPQKRGPPRYGGGPLVC